MTGRMTMLGLSRWSVDGGSYRTVQRFLVCEYSMDENELAFMPLFSAR
ncbi:MAG: hypothetical protein Q9N62_01010 [Ghiorsea sp.]|nr:hypothetical protein [Ghiorsea sp.]